MPLNLCKPDFFFRENMLLRIINAVYVAQKRHNVFKFVRVILHLKEQEAVWMGILLQ